MLINVVKAFSPESLPSEIVFSMYCYSDREPPSPKRRLNEQQLKSLLWCCYMEILEIRRRFKTGQAILAGEKSASTESGMCETLQVIQELNRNSFPSRTAIIDGGIKERTQRRLGGANLLRSYLSLTPQTAIPYFVCIIVQLAGNVEPVLHLTRNCVKPDPLDKEWKSVEWVKPRAGFAPESTQWQFFEYRRKFSAPKLIQDLLAFTEPLLPRVPPSDKNMLFLCGNQLIGEFGLLSYQQITGQWKAFLARAVARIEGWNNEHPNWQRATLPVFELRDLRGSKAVQLYLQKRDIRRVQQMLNHRSPDTAEGYLNHPLTHDVNAKILSTALRLLFSHLCIQPIREGHFLHPGGQRPASASFSNDCREPVLFSDGKPRLRSHFQQCLDCPNLIIPKDAEHFARLLHAKKFFESARERQEPDRWKFFFDDSFRKLKAIISEFPVELKQEAEELMATLPPLPELE